MPCTKALQRSPTLNKSATANSLYTYKTRLKVIIWTHWRRVFIQTWNHPGLRRTCSSRAIFRVFPYTGCIIPPAVDTSIVDYIKARVNPSPNKYAVWRLCSRICLKTLWQKEKLLEMSNISSCHIVWTLFNSYTICTECQYFCLDVCIVAWCRCVVCGKESNNLSLSRIHYLTKSLCNICYLIWLWLS